MQMKSKLFALCGCALLFTACTKEKKVAPTGIKKSTDIHLKSGARHSTESTSARISANFDANVNGNNVTFYCSYYDPNATYTWTFGDGSSIATLRGMNSISHGYKLPNTFPFEDSYVVTLTVTSPTGVVITTTKTIYTFVLPTVVDDVTQTTVGDGRFMYEVMISHFNTVYAGHEWNSGNGVITKEENSLFIYYGPHPDDVEKYYDYYPTLTLTNTATGRKYMVFYHYRFY